MPAHKKPFKKFAWTPALAYIVGLITTDGCLSRDSRHIDFTSKDLQLMEIFRKCLNISNAISRKSSGIDPENKKYYRVQFSNVQLYKWLNSIGLKSRKSNTIAMLKVPSPYFRDFIRGHLDGDGSIRAYWDFYNIYRNRRYNNFRIYTNLISASKKHIDWLHRKLKKELKIRCALLDHPIRNGKPMHVIKGN